jgi:hypothetical protein
MGVLILHAGLIVEAQLVEITPVTSTKVLKGLAYLRPRVLEKFEKALALNIETII